ncbi:MAG: threonine synthase [Acidobacteria bacterium]|nr:threonine synthase [Acidobacteriota bacterium]MBI3473007.1 threonine synthase [Candidatus Solibacter usitatus]
MNTLTHLECSLCRQKFEAGKIHNLCDCGGPLLVRYDLAKSRETWSREKVAAGPHSMWRYAPVLPPTRPESIVSLGEGMTPLVRTPRLGQRLGAGDLWVKDEGLNPTGSFKARGLSCAVSMAVELGIRKVAIPSAGNAASAMAAYAAAAGIEAHIFMPRDVPQSNYIECKAFGAQVTLVDGLISDCAKKVAAGKDTEGWFDVSTLKEPYRIEGKKTMGYEVAEQLGWELPDAIFYPTGGGVGIIGMWKAFEEMQAMGWIGSKRPKMIAVQVAGCQPVVRAYEQGAERSQFWENAQTVAAGLRVPKPLGDFLILEAVRQSGGTALAVTDEELLEAGVRLAASEGLFICPEGAACVSALEKLLASGFLKRGERIVIYNTGAGLKYLEAYAPLFPR